MTDLIDTTEMYLRTVLELEEEGIPALRARIVERLGHTGPTVSETVQRLCRKGLMTLSEGDIRTRTVSLTAEGRAQATSVMRKHRLAERLLADVIGLELPYVHEEACRWEHVMSDRVEVLLEKLLSSPTTSPMAPRSTGRSRRTPRVSRCWMRWRRRVLLLVVPRRILLVLIRFGPVALARVLELARMLPKLVRLAPTASANTRWS